MGCKRSLFIAGLLATLTGCTFHAGPSGIDLAIAGSYYSHTDEQVSAYDPESRWMTHAGRTWGTSGIEGQITTDSETLSITGKGISENLAGVLGEDALAELGQIIACTLQPAQPKCLGIQLE